YLRAPPCAGERVEVHGDDRDRAVETLHDHSGRAHPLIAEDALRPKAPRRPSHDRSAAREIAAMLSRAADALGSEGDPAGGALIDLVKSEDVGAHTREDVAQCGVCTLLHARRHGPGG